MDLVPVAYLPPNLQSAIANKLCIAFHFSSALNLILKYEVKRMFITVGKDRRILN